MQLSLSSTPSKISFWERKRLVAGTTLLNDNGRELLNLPLGSEESTELQQLGQPPPSHIPTLLRYKENQTHPLLGELLGLLVLGVPQQLHDSLLVRREPGNLSDDRPDKSLLLATFFLCVSLKFQTW